MSMRLVKKVALLWVLVAVSLAGCATTGDAVEFQLIQVVPPDAESSEETAPQAAAQGDVPERWVDFSVAEIESEGGRQVRLFSTVTGGTGGVREGMDGIIYEDPGKTREAGKARVAAIGGNFVLFEIQSLNFTINRSAVVSVQVQ